MAYKVGNTTVINDSLQLSNITSVDSTTANAIGAAGVGGSITLISTTTISGNPTYVDLSFSTSYEDFVIILHKLKLNTTANYAYGAVRAQMKDSSGTLITTQGQYMRQDFNTTAGTSNNFFKWGNAGTNIGGADDASTSVIYVRQPRNSNVSTTYLQIESGKYGSTSSAYYYYWQNGNGSIQASQDNSGVRIYPAESTTNIFANTGKIFLYGVK